MRMVLWGIIALLVLVWLTGFIFHLASGLIHLLLWLVCVLIVINIILSLIIANRKNP